MSAKQTPRSKRAWEHNRLIGHAVMMRAQLLAITTSDTTTFAQRKIAIAMARLVVELEEELRKGRQPFKE